MIPTTNIPTTNIPTTNLVNTTSDISTWPSPWPFLVAGLGALGILITISLWDYFRNERPRPKVFNELRTAIDNNPGIQTIDLKQHIPHLSSFYYYHRILLEYGYYINKDKWYKPQKVKNLEWTDAVDLVYVDSSRILSPEEVASAKINLRELQSTYKLPKTHGRRRRLRKDAEDIARRESAYQRKIARKADEYEDMLAVIESRQRTA